MTSTTKRLSKKASIALHQELRALGIKYSDQLILEGVKEVTMEFFNDFKLILKDKKTSKQRLRTSGDKCN